MKRSYLFLAKGLCFLLLVLIGTACAVIASADGNYTYILTNGEATLTGYTGPSVKDVVVPAVIDGYPVKAMGGVTGFQISFNDKVENVTISEGIKLLQADGLSGRGILSVSLPDSLQTIGISSFNCPSLKRLHIPAGVTGIPISIFSNCRALEAITVASGNSVYSSTDGVLYSKDKKKLLAYPSSKAGTSYTIPDTVDTIGEYAFNYAKYIVTMDIPSTVRWLEYSCLSFCRNLTSVTLHDGLLSIGINAFHCTSITSLSIPGTVRNVGILGLLECLESVDVSSSNQFYYSIDGVLFARNFEIYNETWGQTLIEYPPSKSDTEYTIPQGTKGIYAAFRYANKLKKATIPSTTIYYANPFSYCSRLERIDFNNIPVENKSFFALANECSKLNAVYFYQDAPTFKDDNTYYYIFYNPSSSFCIYYDANKTGWSTPTWHGYPARPFNTPTPPTPTDKKAIIVIPGICGSELTDRNNNDVYWLGSAGLLHFRSLFCNADGIPTNSDIGAWQNGSNGDYGVQNTYGPMMNRLQAEFGSTYSVQYFPYDWRYGNQESARKLHQWIQDRGYTSVVLVAHSMGGLVVSEYIHEYGETQTSIESVITLGTPFLGAPKALNALETGEFIKIPFRLDNVAVKLFARNLPSIYELLSANSIFYEFVDIDLNVFYKAAALINPDISTMFTTRLSSYQQMVEFFALYRSFINLNQVRSANNFHFQINQNGTHSILSLGNKLYSVIGTGQRTVVGLTYTRGIKLFQSDFEKIALLGRFTEKPLDFLLGDELWYIKDVATSTDGDGTVPRRSATINNTLSQVFEVEAEHSVLPSNNQALDYIVSVIKKSSIPTSTVPHTAYGTNKLFINCPVDVQILENGTVIGKVENNNVTQVDLSKIGLYVMGSNLDHKLAVLDSSKTYDVVMTGTGTGTMSFTLVMVAADGVTETRSIQFNDVPITASTRITTTSNPNGMALNIDHDGDGTVDETMRPTIDMDLLRRFNIIAAPSANGSIQLSSPTAKYGDIVTATVVADNGYRLAPGSLQFAGLDALGNVTTSFYTLNIGQFPMLYSDVIIKADFAPAQTGSVDGVPANYQAPQTGDNTPLPLLLALCAITCLVLVPLTRRNKSARR